MALVTTKEMFKKAYEGGYAIGAFNINNMEIIQAITEAAAEEKSPVVLQVSAGARKYAKHAYLMGLARAAAEDSGVDFALHLDHGADFEICKSCIDGGFTSVMIDGSHFDYEDNIALTRKVVEYAHERGCVVEGELGVLAGVEDDVVAEHSSYTRPEEVEDFVTRTGVDLALHLDHGADFDICKSCIDGGFSSVMIDGSHHSFEDNIALTKKVVEYAHERGVVVEGELGVLAGVEDDVVAEKSSYTRPEEVEEFVTRTGVDSLAISIGTSHGAYKFTPKQCTRNEKGILVPPPLRFDILEEIEKRLPQFPIVLHGASSVPQEYVQEINSIGGQLPDAVGIPEEQLRKAASMAVCKINIDSDIRLAMTAGIRRVLTEKPDVFDPRTYLTVARAEVKKMVAHKIENVLGSAGKL